MNYDLKVYTDIYSLLEKVESFIAGILFKFKFKELYKTVVFFMLSELRYDSNFYDNYWHKSCAIDHKSTNPERLQELYRNVYNETR